MQKNNITAKFAHKITFEENRAPDELAADNWQEVTKCFAQISPVLDNKFHPLEKMDFGNIIAEEYFKFILRYQGNINKAMRIKFKGRIFEIKRMVNQQEKNRFLTIIALEI